MIRICFALIAAVVLVQAIAGEEPEINDWTRHVIPAQERSFDFKTVAKGAVPEHQFVLKNPFQEPLVVRSVTSSCTCTSAHFDEAKSTLPTYGELVIAVRFHGDLFEGHKNATLTVAIDKPNPAEIQLNIRGEIRGDLQTTPNFLDFGNVDIEKGVSRILTVTYTGSNTQWRLVDTKCENEFIHTEITEIPANRFGTKVFKVNVSLDQSTPHGAIDTRLLLVSNDTETRREIPIPLRATVGTVIRVSPSPLFLGLLLPGEPSPLKSVTLLGTKPFRITKIECDNPAVRVPSGYDADVPLSRTYAVPIQYLNPADGEGAPKGGTMQAEVKITTDIPGLVPTFYVTMRVREKEREAE